jgi:hypothetical protein
MFESYSSAALLAVETPAIQQVRIGTIEESPPSGQSFQTSPTGDVVTRVRVTSKVHRAGIRCFWCVWAFGQDLYRQFPSLLSFLWTSHRELLGGSSVRGESQRGDPSVCYQSARIFYWIGGPHRWNPFRHLSRRA